jgi:CDGSH-type Zn-finger protein/ferredoxin
MQKDTQAHPKQDRSEDLLIEAREIARALAVEVTDREGAVLEPLEHAAARLRRSVIRPLERAPRVNQASSSQEERAGGSALALKDRLSELARAATKLRALSNAPPNELVEATAALQDLAYSFAYAEDPGSASTLLDELRAIQAELPAAIRAARNGPYLVTNAERLVNWLGVPLPLLPQMALCRCGASALKPLCDGSHAEIGFTDEKDPNRVHDRRDTYVGEQVTILDNRGACAHSGYCSDRLRTVFRPDEDPFVAPSGGRMDEIISAVRACPSGALSFAFDGHETREQVDQEREPVIEVSKDGPYRITGGIALEDSEGSPVERNEGASLEH